MVAKILTTPYLARSFLYGLQAYSEDREELNYLESKIDSSKLVSGEKAWEAKKERNQFSAMYS